MCKSHMSRPVSGTSASNNSNMIKTLDNMRNSHAQLAAKCLASLSFIVQNSEHSSFDHACEGSLYRLNYHMWLYVPLSELTHTESMKSSAKKGSNTYFHSFNLNFESRPPYVITLCNTGYANTKVQPKTKKKTPC